LIIVVKEQIGVVGSLAACLLWMAAFDGCENSELPLIAGGGGCGR